MRNEYEEESEMDITNEFGEEFSYKEIKDFAKRVRKLSAVKLDGLWYRCRFFLEDRGENKALSDKAIKKIKEDVGSAMVVLSDMLAETRRGEFKKNLSKLEKEYLD